MNAQRIKKELSPKRAKCVKYLLTAAPSGSCKNFGYYTNSSFVQFVFNNFCGRSRRPGASARQLRSALRLRAQPAVASFQRNFSYISIYKYIYIFLIYLLLFYSFFFSEWDDSSNQWLRQTNGAKISPLTPPRQKLCAERSRPKGPR